MVGKAKRKEKMQPLDSSTIQNLQTSLHDSSQTFFQEAQNQIFRKYPAIAGGYALKKNPPKFNLLKDTIAGSRIHLSQAIEEMKKAVKNDVLPFIQKNSDLNPDLRKNILKFSPLSDQNSILATNFVDELRTGNKLESFLSYRKRITQFLPSWEKNLYDTQLAGQSQDLIKLDNLNHRLHVSWPLIIDSYIRDFEFFMQFLIGPYHTSSISRQKIQYHKKLQLFCGSDTEFLKDLQHTAVKPYIRSLFAHQLYGFDMDTGDFIFVRTFLEYKKHTIPHQTMMSLCRNLSLLVNSALHIIFRFLKTAPQSPLLDKSPRICEQILLTDLNTTFHTQLENLQIFQKLQHHTPFISNLGRILEVWNSRPVAVQKHISTLIVESRLFCRLFLGDLTNLPFNQKYNSISRITYLALYGLTMEKFVKPFYLVFHGESNIRNLPEIVQVEFCQKYKGGKFHDLFGKLNPSLRNAIAHRNFIEREWIQCNQLTYSLAFILFEMDKKFYPEMEDIMLHGGIGELWYSVFEVPFLRWIPQIKSELGALEKYSQFPILAPLAGTILPLLEYLKQRDSKSLIIHLQATNRKLSTLNSKEIDYFWALLLYFLVSQKITVQSQVFFYLFSVYSRSPSNPYLQAAILGFKILHNHARKNFKKEFQYYTKLQTLLTK
ncbi:hypothetical protein [Candidatus Lokiarchaeum ossiferum]|uniref:hypothetical protein n=1 Tax=Candidatus Lokiarchaeum ossiferum TaxID=2951803 RepID=UPI00352F00B3